MFAIHILCLQQIEFKKFQCIRFDTQMNICVSMFVSSYYKVRFKYSNKMKWIERGVVSLYCN